MEWLAQDCGCCQHLQFRGEWNPERCEPVCCRLRFPRRTYAEWELMTRVVKRDTFGVLTPMGGSMQTEWKVREEAFKFWARDVARIKRKRWLPLIDLVEVMHAQVEKLADGKFPFTDDEYEELKVLGAKTEDEILSEADVAVVAVNGEYPNSD